MRLSAVVVIVAACGIIPDEDSISMKAGDKCQQIIDEQVKPLIQQASIDAWEQCTSFYEETVLPTFREELRSLSDEFEMRIREFFKTYEVEVMTRMGCIPEPSLAGWNCVDTPLCIP